jgi:hypothetical protein
VPKYPTASKAIIPVNTKGFAHFANGDPSLYFEKSQENAIELDLALRCGGYGLEAPIVDIFESLGCSLTLPVHDTVAAGAVGAVTVTTETPVGGQAYLVATSTGYWPMLACQISGKEITPLFQLPTAPVPTAVINGMNCLTPREREVPSGASLAFACANRQQFDSTGGDRLLWTFKGCACGDPGVLELKPNEVPRLKAKFHVGDAAATELDMAAESFMDTSPLQVWGANSRVAISDYSNAGGIVRAATDTHVLSAKISFGQTTVPVISAGVGNLNNLQTYMAVYDREKAFIELVVVYDYSSLEDYAGTTKTIEIIQGCQALTDPAWGFWAANCVLKDLVKTDFSDKYGKMTLTYEMMPSKWFGVSENNSTAAYSPWFFAFTTGEN